MKKYTIKNAIEAIETGENEDKHLAMFEITGDENMEISDGYHTMDELYEHRITLYIALCRERAKQVNRGHYNEVWRSKLHSDGSSFDGWFILGIWEEKGEQITYHLPMSKWDETGFAKTLEKAPEWDGHTPADVLNRIARL